MQKISYAALGLTLALSGCAQVKKLTSQQPSAGFVERLEITHRAPAYGGANIEGVGTYEMIAGIAHLKIDPLHSANAQIVDLRLAPRGADGWVQYKTDVLIVRPTDAKKASGVNVFEIVNRGTKIFIPRMNDAPDIQVEAAASAGHGWGLRQGHTWIWAGWQGDIKLGDKGKTIGTDFPVATDGEKPITGLVEEEIVFDNATATGTLPLTYASARADAQNGTLVVRPYATAGATTLPTTAWRYTNASAIEITRPANFDGGAIYSFTYSARDPKVNGVGFTVLRDVMRFLNTSATSPLVDIPKKANLVVGISQSGRFLRDFLWLGFNANPDGGKVFDGAMPLISGSRKSFANARFSQGGRYSRQHEDHDVFGGQFPFTYAVTTDPITSETDGIFAQCERNNTCPKLMHIDSHLEFWQARASLVVSDGLGKSVPIPQNVRLYTMGSTQHSAPPTASAGVCQTLNNPAKQFPTYRALFDGLVKWTTTNDAPPANNYPTLSNGGLAVWNNAGMRESMGFPDLTGLGLAFPSVINELNVTSYASGLPAPARNRTYAIAVPRVDTDGHDRVGILQPDVAVPVATYSGWNVRKEGFAPGQLCGLNGIMVPFAATAAERNAKRDPRLSLAERYVNRADYVARVKTAADALVRDRYLLAEDAARFVSAAANEARVAQ
jgi:hypothetical protein